MLENNHPYFRFFSFYSEITFKSVLQITVKLWYDQIIVLCFCVLTSPVDFILASISPLVYQLSWNTGYNKRKNIGISEPKINCKSIPAVLVQLFKRSFLFLCFTSLHDEKMHTTANSNKDF